MLILSLTFTTSWPSFTGEGVRPRASKSSRANNEGSGYFNAAKVTGLSEGQEKGLVEFAWLHHRSPNS